MGISDQSEKTAIPSGIGVRWRVLFTLRVTVLSIIISLIIYGIIAQAFGIGIESVGLSMSILVPTCVAPIASWVSSGLYSRIQGLNDQLQIASAQIAAQTARKEHMLRRLSHELRTPAAVVNTMAHAPHLLETRSDSLRDASDMMIDILDTLSIAIDDGSDLPMTNRRVVLDSLPRDLAFLAEALATETATKIALDSRISSDLQGQCVSGDILRLKAAALNLVRNGLLHAEAQVLRLSFATSRNADQLRVILRVEDDGKGIPEHEVARLFQPQERGDTRASGSGLGLAIARDWISDMGGRLDYAPSPLGGAGFVITVPLTLADAPADRRPDATIPRKAERIGGRVLLVDDDRLSRTVNSLILNRSAGEVITAANCAEAHDAVLSSSFDMIITDHQMPDGNGAQLIADLRAQGYAGICLGLTASDAPEVHVAYRRSGADDVLVKPMPQDRVLAHLRDAIAQSATTAHYG